MNSTNASSNMICWHTEITDRIAACVPLSFVDGDGLWLVVVQSLMSGGGRAQCSW